MTQTIRRGRIGEPKVAKERAGSWTAAARAVFLEHLAATCHVTNACRAAGRNVKGLYALRRRDPIFAAQWQAALEMGWDRLEAALLEHAIAPLDAAEPIDADTPRAAFDPTLAMKLLALHRTRDGRGGRAAKTGGAPPGRATEAETDAAILAALARIDARQGGA